MTKIGVNVLILIVTLVICFLLVEFTMSNFIRDQELWEYDAVLGSKHLKNKTASWCKEEFCHKFTTNSDGFIDEDFVIEKKGKRILLFGDSFMEALQVDFDDSLAMVLEELSGTEVYNFGVSNHGPVQYLAALKEYGPVYQPDLVIFAIFTQNDLKNINPVLEPDHCRPFLDTEFDCTPSSLERGIKRSKFVRYIYRNRNILKQLNKGFLYQVYDSTDKDFNESFIILDRVLSEGEKFSQQLGSEFMAVTLTNSAQLDKVVWEEIDTGSLDLDYPDQRIRSFCEKEGLNCLNLLYPFREHTRQTGQRLHFKKDEHWNEEGHRLGALEIHKFIKEKRLLN